MHGTNLFLPLRPRLSAELLFSLALTQSEFPSHSWGQARLSDPVGSEGRRSLQISLTRSLFFCFFQSNLFTFPFTAAFPLA